MIALLLRDLKLAFRAGGGFGLGLAFFLIVTVLVPFSVGPQSSLLSTIAPGVLWLGALLACLLSLDRLLALDWEDGSLDLLATAPLPLEAVVTIKALAHWLTTGLPLVLAAPFLGVLLNLPVPGFFWLVISLLIGTPAMSVIGTFGAALTVGLKRGGLFVVTAGSAALCPDADLRRRSRPSRGDRDGNANSAADVGGDHRSHDCAAAICQCRRAADQPSVTLSQFD